MHQMVSRNTNFVCRFQAIINNSVTNVIHSNIRENFGNKANHQEATLPHREVSSEEAEKKITE